MVSFCTAVVTGALLSGVIGTVNKNAGVTQIATAEPCESWVSGLYGQHPGNDDTHHTIGGLSAAHPLKIFIFGNVVCIKAHRCKTPVDSWSSRL